MLDVVFLAMFAVIPVMAWSIYQVKYRRRYALHKAVQLTLGGVLLVAVGLFEIDMQFISGWEDRATDSPYWTSGTVWKVLYVHLFFAVTTLVLWVVVIVLALRRFPSPPQPSAHSSWHLRWARVGALDMFLTAITGWVFYWLAFMAR
jgi:uncharacterized membrane protein YozB (DUF420 family)